MLLVVTIQVKSLYFKLCHTSVNFTSIIFSQLFKKNSLIFFNVFSEFYNSDRFSSNIRFLKSVNKRINTDSLRHSVDNLPRGNQPELIVFYIHD